MTTTHSLVADIDIKRHAELLSFIDRTYIERGKYWTEAAKTFGVALNSQGYLSRGERNYLPEIYSQNAIKEPLWDWVCLKKHIANRGEQFSVKKIKLDDDSVGVNSRKFQSSQLWCQQLYSYDRIKAAVPSFQPKRVLEIGGGSGLMAAVLSAESNAKIFILDLPEMLSVSAAFLLYTFPEKKILLPQEVNENTNFEDFDFVLLSIQQRNLLPAKYFDFILNIASFQEMDAQEVSSYFDLCEHSLAQAGYFFCSNRIRKMTNFFKYPWQKLSDFEEVFNERSSFRRDSMRGTSTFMDRLMVRTEKQTKQGLNPTQIQRNIRDYLLQFSLYWPDRKFWLKHDLRANSAYKFLKKIKQTLRTS